MPRIARVVIPRVPHHITHRGNNRQAIFFVDDDRRFYLETLRENCQRYGLILHGYCLMTNHVHLVLTPPGPAALARAIGRAHLRHSLYIHRLHGHTGHLWAGRFYSCALDAVHFWRTLVYVERNPVRARLRRSAWLYPWSSAAAHVEATDANGLLDMAEWRRAARRLNWKRELARPEDKELGRRLRACTGTGRPLGTAKFVARQEARLGRRLRPLPHGRPRKRKRAK